MKKTCDINLFDEYGNAQSGVTVEVRPNGLKYWLEVWGGNHISIRPLALIRRIARDWFDDGGDRSYTGQDEQTGVTFRVTPTREMSK